VPQLKRVRVARCNGQGFLQRLPYLPTGPDLMLADRNPKDEVPMPTVAIVETSCSTARSRLIRNVHVGCHFEQVMQNRRQVRNHLLGNRIKRQDGFGLCLPLFQASTSEASAAFSFSPDPRPAKHKMFLIGHRQSTSFAARSVSSSVPQGGTHAAPSHVLCLLGIRRPMASNQRNLLRSGPFPGSASPTRP